MAVENDDVIQFLLKIKSFAYRLSDCSMLPKSYALLSNIRKVFGIHKRRYELRIFHVMVHTRFESEFPRTHT